MRFKGYWEIVREAWLQQRFWDLNITHMSHCQSHCQPDPAAQVCWILRRDWRDSEGLMWGLLCFRKTNDSGRPLTSITVGNKAELGGCLATLLYLRPPLGRTVVVWILGGGISSPFYSCFLLLLLFWMNELVANRCGSYLQLREKVQKVQVSLCRRQQMLGGRPIPAEQEPPVLHASHPLLQ